MSHFLAQQVKVYNWQNARCTKLLQNNKKCLINNNDIYSWPMSINWTDYNDWQVEWIQWTVNLNPHPLAFIDLSSCLFQASCCIAHKLQWFRRCIFPWSKDWGADPGCLLGHWMPLHGIPRFRPCAKVRVPRISCCKVGKKHLQTRGRLVKNLLVFLFQLGEA